MRRKPGALVPLEIDILEVALALRTSRIEEFHGFQMAKFLKSRQAAKPLAGHGTLYRALDRLAKAALLSRRWEDQQLAHSERRPPRRLYRITSLGEAAVAEAKWSEAKEAALQFGGQLAPP